MSEPVMEATGVTKVLGQGAGAGAARSRASTCRSGAAS